MEDNYQDRFQEIHARLQAIELRNKKVSQDKRWETSITRKLIITLLTYLVMTLLFFALRNDDPFMNALIPTTGFVLSTFSLSILRRCWEKYQK